MIFYVIFFPFLLDLTSKMTFQPKFHTINDMFNPKSIRIHAKNIKLRGFSSIFFEIYNSKYFCCGGHFEFIVMRTTGDIRNLFAMIFGVFINVSSKMISWKQLVTMVTMVFAGMKVKGNLYWFWGHIYRFSQIWPWRWPWNLV